MKVNSNNIPQLNIANNTNVLYKNIGSLNNGLKPAADTFNKDLTNLTAKTTTKPLNSLYSSFSPNQILSAYCNPNYVNFLAMQNPNVKALLDSKGVNYEVHPENVMGIANTHLMTTKAFALQIANQMNISPSEKQQLEQACVFHDFGKILIPDEIINKPGELNDNERDIMNLHARLGYELLSITGMNKRVLELIKNHHLPSSQNQDILGQILSVADIYSALREQRPYKNPLTQTEALNILDQKAQNGEVSTEVVNALKASLSSRVAA